MNKVQYYSQLDTIKLSIDSCSILLNKDTLISDDSRVATDKLVLKTITGLSSLLSEREYENIKSNEED
jgi:hypothetical protein